MSIALRRRIEAAEEATARLGESRRHAPPLTSEQRAERINYMLSHPEEVEPWRVARLVELLGLEEYEQNDT